VKKPKIVEDMLESLNEGKVTSMTVKIVDEKEMILYTISSKMMSEREIHEHQHRHEFRR